jgi:hypothetical protein
LLDLVADEGGPKRRRLGRLARDAARAAHRAGTALVRDRPASARRALGQAVRRMRTIERAASGPLASSIGEAAGALRVRLSVLRAAQRGSSLGAGGGAPRDPS